MELRLGNKYYDHDLDCELRFVGYLDSGELWFEDDEGYKHIINKEATYLLEPVVMDLVDELRFR